MSMIRINYITLLNVMDHGNITMGCRELIWMWIFLHKTLYRMIIFPWPIEWMHIVDYFLTLSKMGQETCHGTVFLAQKQSIPPSLVKLVKVPIHSKQCKLKFSKVLFVKWVHHSQLGLAIMGSQSLSLTISLGQKSCCACKSRFQGVLINWPKFMGTQKQITWVCFIWTKLTIFLSSWSVARAFS